MRMKNALIGSIALGTLASGVIAAGTVGAQELRFASGYPSGSIPAEALEVYEQTLEDLSEGSVSIRAFHLSLLDLEETATGIREGLADMGIVLTPYSVAEFPHMNMISELSMLLETEGMTTEHRGPAFAGAMMEYVFNHCPECKEDFLEQNQIYLGGASSPEYALLCTTEVRTLDDLDGKRLRIGGPQWARWADELGASPSTMSVNEIYEGLNQGVVDCSVQSAPELSVFQLFDIVDNITVDTPGGVFGGVGSSNMNANTWRGLDDDQRGALLRAGATLSAEFTWRYEAEGIENLERARDEGIAIHEADEALIDATRSFIERDLEAIAESYADRYGIENSEEMIDEFRPILERWVELASDLADSEELADLYWDEIYSEIDPSTYGM